MPLPAATLVEAANAADHERDYEVGMASRRVSPSPALRQSSYPSDATLSRPDDDARVAAAAGVLLMVWRKACQHQVGARPRRDGCLVRR